jgi:IS1 family transposase
MNKLATERRAQVIGCLVEGMSIRATVRVTGVAKNTIVKLLADLGHACSEFQDGAFNNLNCKIIEADEIWAFCYSKQKNVPEEFQDTFGYGDVWTWTAIDAETKLVPSWLVGERTVADCYTFLADLKSRLNPGRIQLTTDGLGAYTTVADALWRNSADFAQIVKTYGNAGNANNEQRYSPAVCTGMEVHVRTGDPDPAHISTSYVERQNLSMRMGMRRFTRLTNAFSKKVENLAHAVSLHFMYYNFCLVHSSLTIKDESGKSIKRTPAMAAGIADYPWSLTQLAGLLD